MEMSRKSSLWRRLWRRRQDPEQSSIEQPEQLNVPKVAQQDKVISKSSVPRNEVSAKPQNLSEGHKAGANEHAVSGNGDRSMPRPEDVATRVKTVENAGHVISGAGPNPKTNPILSPIKQQSNIPMTAQQEAKLPANSIPTNQILAEPPTLLEVQRKTACMVTMSRDVDRSTSRSEDATVRVNEVENTRHILPDSEPDPKPKRKPVPSSTKQPDQVNAPEISQHPDAGKTRPSAPEVLAKPLSLLKGHEGAVRAVVFSCDGNRIISGSDDGTIGVWDAKSGQRVDTSSKADGPRHYSYGRILSLAIWPNESFVAAATRQGTTFVDPFHPEQARDIYNINELVALSPNGRLLAGGLSSPDIWDLTTGERRWMKLDYVLSSLSFSPDNAQLACGYIHGDTQVLNILDLKVRHHSVGVHGGSVTSIAYSPDGKVIATAGADGCICVQVASSGLRTFKSPMRMPGIRSLVFSPSGLRVAAALVNGTVVLWDAVNWRRISVLQGHSREVLSLAFSPTGTLLVSASQDQTLRLWELSGDACPVPKAEIGAPPLDAAQQPTGADLPGIAKLPLRFPHLSRQPASIKEGAAKLATTSSLDVVPSMPMQSAFPSPSIPPPSTSSTRITSSSPIQSSITSPTQRSKAQVTDFTHYVNTSATWSSWSDPSRSANSEHTVQSSFSRPNARKVCYKCMGYLERGSPEACNC